MIVPLKPLATLLVALHAAAPSAAVAATTSYHIGNSLTADMAPHSFAAFAAQRELTHEAGYHLRNASSLNLTLATPSEVSVTPPEPFGTFANALPNFKWNAVTIQPHWGLGSTMATDVDSILSVINLARTHAANANTRFYIFSTWPLFGDFQTNWTAPTVDDAATPTALTRDYFEHLLARVRAQTDATVLMIPVGDVLHELDVRLSAGLVQGYSSVLPFYRDGLHMNGALGQYTAALTTFATIRGEIPIDFVKPENTFSYDSIPPNADAIYEAVNDAIRDVVGAHPFSGITFPDPPRTDFDQSGLVDGADLAFLQQSLGKSAVADGNRDGEVNDEDEALYWSQLGLSSRKTSDFDPSDVDQDGVTDGSDLAVWRESMGLNPSYDVDRDGDSDGQDFLSWQREVTPTFAGDFNRDHVVDAADFELWQANNGFSIRADANGDGVVDQQDYAVWQEEEGRIWPVPFSLSRRRPSSRTVGLDIVGVGAIRLAACHAAPLGSQVDRISP